MQRAGEEYSRERDQPVQRPYRGGWLVVVKDQKKLWSRAGRGVGEDEVGEGRARLDHQGLLSHCTDFIFILSVLESLWRIWEVTKSDLQFKKISLAPAEEIIWIYNSRSCILPRAEGWHLAWIRKQTERTYKTCPRSPGFGLQVPRSVVLYAAHSLSET